MGISTGNVWWVAALLCCLSRLAAADVTIDAFLSEDEWLRAPLYTKFQRVQPLPLNEPSHATLARVLATAAGLVVGVECFQPEALRVRGRSQRDAPTMDADAVRIAVDFEGDGNTAYEFTVSLSGSVRDGIVLQQNRIEYAWDGLWYSAVRETSEGWQVEVLLPWSLAPMGTIHDSQRTVGFHVSRELRARGEVLAYPGIPLQSPSLVRDFQKLAVPVFNAMPLTATPYASVSRDLLSDDTDARGGLDLLWRPTSTQQLTATLNPDFGQIESDDLLVNFSAVEIFVPDKRPFFTENQHLFDIRTNQVDRLVHTKRIGSAPDAGPEGSSDVLAAAKYLWSGAGWELGGFVAIEDDSSVARGRTYAAARSRWQAGTWSLGYLGTLTDRPTLTRSVLVHSADAEWSPASGWRLTGQLITTSPHQRDDSGIREGTGHGVLAKLEYGGTASIAASLYLTWYDRSYDTNDLGFLERNSLREVRSQTRWFYRRQYPLSSRLLGFEWYLSARARTNDFGARLPSWMQVGPIWRYKDGSYLFIYMQPTTSGIDDLSSRGNGSFKVPPQHEAHLSFSSDPARMLQYYCEFALLREGLQRYGWEVQLKPSWRITEDLKLGLTMTYRDSSDWLIWRPDVRRMVQHERELVQIFPGVEWFPSPRSEIRLKLQWTALRARGLGVYDIRPTRDLIRSAAVPSDFSRSEFALQLRFRYQWSPLSDLYIAYSLGGLADESEDRIFRQLLSSSITRRTAHQLMIKVAYKL